MAYLPLYPPLMRRRRVDPKSFDHSFACAHCGYAIPPAELVHIDGKHIRCPKCGKDSVYITTKPQSTS